MNKLKIVVLTYLLLPTLAFAAIDSEAGVIKVFENIANTIFSFFLMAAVITILVAAFKFLNASSSPDKAGEAKRMLAYAAVAIAIALLSKGIPFIIQEIVLGQSQSDAEKASELIGSWW